LWSSLGIRVDARDYLQSVEQQAKKDQEAAINRFLAWARKKTPNGALINPSSAAQIQTFLFGGMGSVKDKKSMIPPERSFKVRRGPEV